MIKLKGFKKGGIHPHDRKDITKDKKLEKMPYPKTLHILINQHIGAPCDITVKENDRVLKNQIIAKSDAFISSIVHSPVSGIVKEIKEIKNYAGKKDKVVIIENDEKYELFENAQKKIKSDYTFEEFIDIVKNAGIIGMGGAGFPTHVKLNPPKDRPIDTFIVNAAECEPFLNADYRAIIEYTEKLLSGIGLILDALQINIAYIGIENNKMDAYKLLKEKNKDKRISIELLKTRYPQGAEKQLIYAITNRVVPIRKLPFEVGVIVQNVGTVLAIYDAVNLNKPLTERILTVSGDGINEPKNIIAPIGTMVKDIIEYCGGLKDNVKYAINGGPMMGKAFDNLELPITKTTSGLLFLTENITEEVVEFDCIRCSKCLHVCPMGLNPTFLMDVSKKRKYEYMDDVLDCIECGSCTYICPSNRDIAASIIKGKEKYNKYLKRSKKNG